MLSVRCPICDRVMQGQPREWPQFPFCSARCRLIDLGRWLNESYHVPQEVESEPPLDEGRSDEVP